jgi:uncharacterized HAD superfamily protein
MARIAIDIDSTLHHYWPLFARIAEDRFGVRLDYGSQRTWRIGELAHEQLAECVRESHSEQNILAGVPYPDAVETVRDWHARGHWIHVTSHRHAGAHDATARWLDSIGLPFDDLHCSYDKVTRCVELGIDVLIDDSPVKIRRARESGILAATLVHPWNEELVAEDGAIGARDWRELRERLDPLLG